MSRFFRPRKHVSSLWILAGARYSSSTPVLKLIFDRAASVAFRYFGKCREGPTSYSTPIRLITFSAIRSSPSRYIHPNKRNLPFWPFVFSIILQPRIANHANSRAQAPFRVRILLQASLILHCHRAGSIAKPLDQWSPVWPTLHRHLASWGALF